MWITEDHHGKGAHRVKLMAVPNPLTVKRDNQWQALRTLAQLLCSAVCSPATARPRLVGLASQRGSDGSRAESAGRCAESSGRRLAEDLRKEPSRPRSAERRGRGREGQNGDGRTAARLGGRWRVVAVGRRRRPRLATETRHASAERRLLTYSWSAWWARRAALMLLGPRREPWPGLS